MINTQNQQLEWNMLGNMIVGSLEIGVKLLLLEKSALNRFCL